MTTPEKEKISIRVQLKAVMQNRPYLLALVGQVLFGFTLYGRNADVLYYFTYVEGNASYYTTYSMCIIIPSIIGAACFQPVFRKLNNKGRTASLFALLTGISMLAMYFFNVKESPAAFYALAGITQFFFSGFNTAIYAIIPDCVEYGEWKTAPCGTSGKIRLCGKPGPEFSRAQHHETFLYHDPRNPVDRYGSGAVLLQIEQKKIQ